MKTNLKINHDYLTLSIDAGLKAKVNLTINRRGSKITASPDIHMPTFELIGNELDRLESKNPFGDYGKLMENLRDKAERAADLSSFANMMETTPSKQK